MRPAQLHHTLLTREQLQHNLAFEFWTELPSLAHLTFPLLDYDTAFCILSNLWGSLQAQ